MHMNRITAGALLACLAACSSAQVEPDYGAAVRLVEDGRAAAKAGNHRKAVTLYTDAAKINPESAEAFYERGVSRVQLRLEKDTKDDVRSFEEQALLDFSTAIRLNPAYGNAYFNRAMILSSRGQYKPAAQDLLDAARARPQDPEPNLWLARLYEEKFEDRGLDALARYEKYVELGGTDPDAREKVRAWREIKRQAAPPAPAPGGKAPGPEDEENARKAHEEALRLFQDGRRDEGAKALEALMGAYGHTRYLQDPDRARAIRTAINVFKPK
jgi:tetratricopeptide (TPR) repeat protein